MYEKIVLIGELRSGGKWLKSIFDPSHYMDLREFFSPLPQNGLTPDGYKSHVHAGHKLVDILVPILKYSNIDIKLVTAIHDVLVSLEISNNGVINNKFSNLEICSLITKTMKQLNKGSIIKLLPCIEHTTEMINFIDNSDLCIKFYRKNIMKLYISHMKSLISGCWSNQEAKNNNIDKNLLKIVWDPEHYISYYHNMVNSYNTLLKNNYKNSITISYEDIHESGMNQDQKLQFMKKLIHNTISKNIKILSNPVLDSEIKESSISDISDNFSNKQDFIRSEHQTPIFLP